MKTIQKTLILCILLISFGAIAQTDKDQEIMADAEKAKQTLIAKDKGVQKFFDNASGYAIFPNVGKGGLIVGGASGNGGLIVGGASGNGVVYDDGSPIGMTSLKKVNIGLQA